MPTIVPQARPVVTSATEDSYRNPLKVLQASATGMTIKEKVETKEGQTDIPVETQAPAVTLSPQMTALARKEQKFRQQEQAFKDEQAKFAAEKAEVKGFTDLKAKLAAKDYSVLDELGVSYEEWTNYLLNKGEDSRPEVQAIKKLESKVNELETKQVETVNKQYEATVNQYRKDIKTLIDTNPAYESVKEMKAEGHVLQHILDTFNEDGEVLTIEQASKEIEDYIVAEAEKMANLRAIKAKQAKATPEKVLPPPKSGLRTLTNQATQNVKSEPPKNQFQHLSPAERIKKAIERANKQG